MSRDVTGLTDEIVCVFSGEVIWNRIMSANSSLLKRGICAMSHCYVFLVYLITDLKFIDLQLLRHVRKVEASEFQRDTLYGKFYFQLEFFLTSQDA